MRSKSVVLAVIIGVIAIGAIIVVADRREAAATSNQLSGTTIDGEAFELSSAKGKPAVVNFFAEWCPPCNMEARELVAFSEAHPEAAVIGVGWDDDQPDIEAFVKKYGIRYPVVMDESRQIGDAWGVTAIPTTFFLDAQGVVQDTIVGAASRELFEASLQKAM